MTIKGKRIVEVRLMSDRELASQGWEHESRHMPVVLCLDDGSLLFASQDEEGNGPGAMFGVNAKGQSFQLFVSAKRS